MNTFAQLLIGLGVLRKGKVVILKSGNKSLHYLDFGEMASAEALKEVGEHYWKALKPKLDPERSDKVTLLGLAYKGIPLVVATAIAASRDPAKGISVSMMYNRKEEKDHGEGGVIVGESPDKRGEVWVVDDVISYGTSFAEAEQHADIYGMIVGVDRLERREGSTKTVSEELVGQGRVKCFVSVATMDELKR